MELGSLPLTSFTSWSSMPRIIIKTALVECNKNVFLLKDSDKCNKLIIQSKKQAVKITNLNLHWCKIQTRVMNIIQEN
jgi:hypothetical protein